MPAIHEMTAAIWSVLIQRYNTGSSVSGAPDQANEFLDMRHGRCRLDAVAKIEDVWTIPQGAKDAPDALSQRLTARH